jgi:hypothetical protein
MLNASTIPDQIRHHLHTPLNAYLGSDYGTDPKSLLQRALTAGEPEAFLAKMQRDVPMLGLLAPGALNLYAAASRERPDRLDLVIEVSGQAIVVAG